MKPIRSSCRGPWRSPISITRRCINGCCTASSRFSARADGRARPSGRRSSSPTSLCSVCRVGCSDARPILDAVRLQRRDLCSGPAQRLHCSRHDAAIIAAVGGLGDGGNFFAPAGGAGRTTALWLAVGVALGGAGLSKYSAIFAPLGFFGFFLGAPKYRACCGDIRPYLVPLVALAICSPALIWNCQNEWLSLSFQVSRATPQQLSFRHLVLVAVVGHSGNANRPLVAVGFRAAGAGADFARRAIATPTVPSRSRSGWWRRRWRCSCCCRCSASTCCRTGSIRSGCSLFLSPASGLPARARFG